MHLSHTGAVCMFCIYALTVRIFTTLESEHDVRWIGDENKERQYVAGEDEENRKYD